MQPTNKPKRKFAPGIFWLYSLIFLFIVGLYFSQDNSVTKSVDWTEFEKAAVNGDIESIIVFGENKEAEGILTKQGEKNQKVNDSQNTQKKLKTTIPSSDKLDDKIDAWNIILEKEGKPAISVKYEKSSEFTKVLYYFGPILVFILFMVIISRRMNGGAGGGGGIFNVGKSKPKVFDKNNANNNVTFKDVAGLAEAKVEIQEIVDFLKNPVRYTELGAKIPKGALLVGPPGTGKTLLAKAVAGEAGVPFLSMSGSDFVEMFVGVGAARVRDLFKQAKEKAPCIVFIDEIDAVGRARGKNPNMGSNDERENTLNQMLTEMDGFGTNNGVIILAATNRADMLDKALLRPGRFDRQIYVDLPELPDRVEIFNVHLRNIKVNATIDIEHLARQTPGFSGADIANVCNEAALIAARNNKPEVSIDDFRAAIDRIIGGLEKSSKVFTKDEKFAIATHEAGHATVSWMLEYGEPLVKVTIVPRGRAQGYAMYAPEERQYYPTQAYIDKICSLVAGRAAEDLFTGQISLGAFDDLEKATKAALSLVAYYGYSDKLKNINYYDSNGQTYGFTKPYSEHTAQLIDEEVARIVNEQYERAKDILRQYAEQHNKIRDLLVERESVFTEDVKSILGERQWKSRTDEIMEIKGSEAKPQNSSTSTSTPDNTPTADNAPVSNDDDDAGTPPPFTKK